MHRERLARFISSISGITALAIYVPILFEFSQNTGFFLLLPVWMCLVLGFVVALIWIENRIAGKQSASPEVHNSNFPVPSVRASGWHEILMASEASVAEAFRTTKGRRYGFIGVVREDGDELVLRWNRKGWNAELLPNGSRRQEIAVDQDSNWHGREVIFRRWPDVIFKRTPDSAFDDDSAKGIARHFLGWDEMPHNVGWSTVVHR